MIGIYQVVITTRRMLTDTGDNELRGSRDILPEGSSGRRDRERLQNLCFDKGDLGSQCPE